MNKVLIPNTPEIRSFILKLIKNNILFSVLLKKEEKEYIFKIIFTRYYKEDSEDCIVKYTSKNKNFGYEWIYNPQNKFVVTDINAIKNWINFS